MELVLTIMMVASVPILLIIYGIVSFLYSPLKKHVSNQISQNEQMV